MERQSTPLIKDEMSKKIIRTAESLAAEQGVESLSVRKILQALNISNRVFYNRFSNIEQVLQEVYKSTVVKIRSSLIDGFDPQSDFFEQIKDIAANTLLMSYENKNKLNYYVFQADSGSDDNYKWWHSEIKRIIDLGTRNGYLKKMDTDAVSYAIWCFIRGYNADALGRRLEKNKAVANFRYAFGILLDGMRA